MLAKRLRSIFTKSITIIFLIFRSLLGSSYCCKHQITCSDYARTAFSQYEFFTACKKIIIRIATCHPFSSTSSHYE